MLGELVALLLDAVDDIFLLQNVVDGLGLVQYVLDVGRVDERGPESILYFYPKGESILRFINL